MNSVHHIAPARHYRFRPARLLPDERRLQDWYESLDDAARNCGYALPEIRAATGVPATRLKIVLYRLGWSQFRTSPSGVLLYRGPSQDSPCDEAGDMQRIIRQFEALKR